MTTDDVVQITFLPGERTVRGRVGQTLMEAAQAGGIEIDNACGGVAACGTCHVIVREGASLLGEETDDEADGLDMARGVTSRSRLSCQARLIAPGQLLVEVPDWNTNLVSEND